MENNNTFELLLEERIAYAEKRRDDVLSNGTTEDLIYWNGYINGLRSILIHIKLGKLVGATIDGKESEDTE